MRIRDEGKAQIAFFAYKEEISLEDVAKQTYLSRVYFCSYFKKITGTNFVDVLNQYRIEKAKELLKSTNMNISAIAEEVGYKSIPYFYKLFTHFTNLSPAQYRKEKIG
ncbi:MAG: helix-turn-helix transcriptional regulator [Clostridia bacterium]|nr:helix-turn-helix transcriptional regulator [Clostridia bacterium]